jgi:pimeloyl-ACP methyl ester carboxylesterase
MAETAGLTVIEPERERYRADLILVHGLWVGSAIWRAAAAGFAHRGWRCLLLDLPAAQPPDQVLSWPRFVADVVRERPVKPIVIGHDAGALLALDLAARGAVRGAIAVAPLLEGLHGLLPPVVRATLRLRRGSTSLPPPAWGQPYFERIPPEHSALVRAGLAAEPVSWLREVEQLTAPAAPTVPTLLVAQQADAVASQLLLEICARGIEADFLRCKGGHWPMLEGRVDDWITQLHRWIIKRVGHGLLILRGDEDLVDEP